MTPPVSTPSELQLTVNGDPVAVPEGTHVAGLLRHLGRDPEAPGVAVAVNQMVVRRGAWAETALEEGDEVEVITASQGG